MDNNGRGELFYRSDIKSYRNMLTQSESLEKTIKYCGMRSGDLAALAGISRSYLSEICKGRANPTVDVIEKLLSVMDERKAGCRQFFYLSCAGMPASPEEHVEEMSPSEAASYMRAIASKFISSSGKKQDTREITDEPLQIALVTS